MSISRAVPGASDTCAASVGRTCGPALPGSTAAQPRPVPGPMTTMVPEASPPALPSPVISGRMSHGLT